MEELTLLKSTNHKNSPVSDIRTELEQDIVRLKSELERQITNGREALQLEQSRHSQNVKNLEAQIEELKKALSEIEAEHLATREKREQMRAEWLAEHENRLAEATSAFEREKQVLSEENMRLTDDINHLIETIDQIQREKSHIETKFKDALQRRETAAGKF